MTVDEKLIRNKIGLLDLAAYLKNVSEACRVMGYSRHTFYRAKRACEDGGLEALKEKSRRVPNIKNRASEATERDDPGQRGTRTWDVSCGLGWPRSQGSGRGERGLLLPD